MKYQRNNYLKLGSKANENGNNSRRPTVKELRALMMEEEEVEEEEEGRTSKEREENQGGEKEEEESVEGRDWCSSGDGPRKLDKLARQSRYRCSCEERCGSWQ